MPNKVEITQPEPNIVRVTQTNNVVQIIENRLSLSVSAGSGGSGSSFELGTDLVVTNSIGDAIAGSTTYTAGTNLETIIQDILAPFLEPAITSITGYGANLPGFSEDGNFIFPTGDLGNVVGGYFIHIDNIGNLDNNSGISIAYNYNLGTSLYSAATYNFDSASSPLNIGLNAMPPVPLTNNGTSYTVTFTFAYLGNNGEGNPVTLSTTRKLIYRHPVYVVANSSSTFTSVANLISTGTTVRTLLTADPTEATQTISFACSSATANLSNYTYLIIPSIFTAEEMAATTSGLGVADYTDSFVLDTNNGNGYNQTQGAATRNYHVYRSNQTGAFDDDIDLTITLTT